MGPGRTRGRRRKQDSCDDANVASLERKDLADELARMREGRDRLEIELEMIRFSRELGKDKGADRDNLINNEKTRVVVHLANMFDLPHKDLPPWRASRAARSTTTLGVWASHPRRSGCSNPSRRRSSRATSATATDACARRCATRASARAPPFGINHADSISVLPHDLFCTIDHNRFEDEFHVKSTLIFPQSVVHI